MCPSDCNEIRFDIMEMKTSPINVKDLCHTHNGKIGYLLTRSKMWESGGYYTLPYGYHNMTQQNNTFKIGDKTFYSVCLEVMSKDVAIVNVYFASNKFTKTVMDKRLTFGDKLSSFGKQHLK